MTVNKWFYTTCAAYVLALYTLTETWPVSVFIDVGRYAGQQDEVWWREWISATSGWAAAMAAAVTILFIVEQIRATEKSHKENVMLLELPHRTAVKKAISHLYVVNSSLLGLEKQYFQENNNDDIYTFYGDDFLTTFDIIKEQLNDPVFERLQAIDDNYISSIHKGICTQLYQAISSCKEGIVRRRDETLNANEHQRRLEAQQVPSILRSVSNLQRMIIENGLRRFPDLDLREYKP